MRIGKNTFAALLALLSLPLLADEPRRLDTPAAPATFHGAKVIGTIQYGTQPKTTKIEQKVTDSRGRVVGYRFVQPAIPRVISSNDLMKMTCVNDVCTDYVPAGRDVRPFFQPGPDAPIPARTLDVVMVPVVAK